MFSSVKKTLRAAREAGSDTPQEAVAEGRQVVAQTHLRPQQMTQTKLPQAAQAVFLMPRSSSKVRFSSGAKGLTQKSFENLTLHLFQAAQLDERACRPNLASASDSNEGKGLRGKPFAKELASKAWISHKFNRSRPQNAHLKSKRVGTTSPVGHHRACRPKVGAPNAPSGLGSDASDL